MRMASQSVIRIWPSSGKSIGAVPAMVAALFLILLGAGQDNSSIDYVVFWCLVASGVYSIYGPYGSLSKW